MHYLATQAHKYVLRFYEHLNTRVHMLDPHIVKILLFSVYFSCVPGHGGGTNSSSCEGYVEGYVCKLFGRFGGEQVENPRMV